MSEDQAWRGNWRVRLHERVRERGFTSITAFAEARPAVPLYLLANELGKDDIAGAQVLSELFVEAERRKQVTRFVRDVFARELAECLPDGWPPVLDDANRFKFAMAIGSWIADIPDTHQGRARQVRDVLLASPPPPGWQPMGPDDELLLTLLPDDEA